MNDLIVRLYDDDLKAVLDGRPWAFVPKRLAPKPGERVKVVGLGGKHASVMKHVGNVIADKQGISQDWALVEFVN